MSEVYYVAFIVDRDLCVNTTVIVEAGVDLLAGPFPTLADAEGAIRLTCRHYPRLAAFAGLATFLMTPQREAPVRLEVIPVRQEQVIGYNIRHHLNVPWPPALLALPECPVRERAG